MRRGMVFGLAVLAVAMLLPAGFAQAQNGDGDMMSPPEFGGNIRIRPEYKRPFNYVDSDGGDPTGDDGVYMRTQLQVDWELVNDIAVFIQAQDSRAWGSDIVIFDDADPDIDIPQAYVTMNNLQNQHGLGWLGENNMVNLYVGRKALPTLGDGYILGTNDWANTGPFAMDGLWFDMAFGGEDLQVDVDLVWADLVNSDAYLTGANGPSEDTVFYGVQAGTDDIDFVGGDVYFWTFDQDIGGADFDVQIYGVRLYTNLPEDTLDGFLAVFEYAMQTGDAGTSDVDADFMLIRAEYALDVDDYDPVFGIGMSIASGDGDPTDNDEETWISPLDENHTILGHYDLVDNSNVQDIFITSRVTVVENVNVHLDIHLLSLDDDSDGWYTQGGSVIGGGPGQDDELGTEIDLYAVWHCGSNLVFQGGYSRFMAGDGVEDATGGFDDDGDFFYLQMTVPFGSQANGHSDEM